MNTDAINFWQRVNELLKKSGKTQIELCKDCGFSLNSFRNRISVASSPNVFDAYKIACYLNTSIDYLITGKAAESSPDDLARLKDIISRAKAVLSES